MISGKESPTDTTKRTRRYARTARVVNLYSKNIVGRCVVVSNVEKERENGGEKKIGRRRRQKKKINNNKSEPLDQKRMLQ